MNGRRFGRANKKLVEAGLYIDDSSMNTPIDILSKCRRLKREGGLDLVMIDYLQLRTVVERLKITDNKRLAEINQISKNCRLESWMWPIIVLLSFLEAVETRKDHRPVLSDLRESGSIEQDADIVMFIYKAEMYNDVPNEDEPGVCELNIAKHRNGSLDTIKLRWFGEYTTFTDIDFKPKAHVRANEEAELLKFKRVILIILRFC